jgi:hypothetical protein
VSRASRFAEPVGLFLLFVVLAAVMTWPLAFAPGLIPDSDDAQFSIWRLAWIAHQLPRDPAHLFDANIFFPDRNTLAYSDAMVLVGAAAAPLFWAGLDPVRIHNLLLVLALASSMSACYALARRLTADRGGAIFAAVIFGLCPYRFAHIGHLELQWLLWMPLSLLALHWLFESPSWRAALALGATVAAQLLCSIYYGVFLSLYLGAAWLILALQRGGGVRVARYTVAAAVPLLIAIAIYAPPYSRARDVMGPRAPAELAQFSATPSDYASVPPQNRVQQSLGLRVANDEHSLFPGFLAILFAAAAFWPPVSRTAWLYGALAMLAFDLSLGANGLLLGALRQAAPIITSLRSSARFGILAVLSLAVLAALAASRLDRARSWGSRVTALAIALVIVESASLPIRVRALDTTASDAHLFLRTLPADAVVLELPVPRPDALWLYETTHQVHSINHWRRLVNGYSGFVPAAYEATLTHLAGFPDEGSARHLREIGVRFVLVNKRFYEPATYRALDATLSVSPHFENFRRIGHGDAEVIVVQVPN